MSATRLFQGSIAAALFTLVSACGGGGGGGGGSSASVPSTQSAGSSSTLFVSDAANSAIGSQINANPSTGGVVLDRLIAGTNTGLNTGLNGLAIDSTADRLYTTQGTSIRVFDNAGVASGNIAPSRIISQVSAGGYRSPVLDKTNDRLYVASLFDFSFATSSIYVFNGASTASNALPARTITSSFGGSGTPSLYSIALDTSRNKLYALVKNDHTVGTVTYSSDVRVAVFNNASTLNGTVSPDSYINIGSNSEAGTVIIDSANDRLYVSMYSVVHVFDNASTLSGSASPTRSIVFGGAPTILHAAVDVKNNRLYALSSHALYIVDNANTATGNVTAKQILVPGAGNMTAVAIKQ